MKTVLLGLDNPHSADPAMALHTRPTGASGSRLWLMIKVAANQKGLDFSESDYLEGFSRRNLDSSENYRKGRLDYGVIMSALSRRTVVMLGKMVPRALGISDVSFDLEPRLRHDFIYYVVPHPSGRCREYNDPAMRHRVGNLLLKLYHNGDK